jgi:hypothetical protein
MRFNLLSGVFASFLSVTVFATQPINKNSLQVEKLWTCQFQEMGNGSYTPSSEGTFSFTSRIPVEWKGFAEASFVNYRETAWADMLEMYRVSNDGKALIGFSFKYDAFAITLIEDNGDLNQYWLPDDSKVGEQLKGEIPAEITKLYMGWNEGVEKSQKKLAVLLQHSYVGTAPLKDIDVKHYMFCPASSTQSKESLLKDFETKYGSYLDSFLKDENFDQAALAKYEASTAVSDARKALAKLRAKFTPELALEAGSAFYSISAVINNTCVGQRPIQLGENCVMKVKSVEGLFEKLNAIRPDLKCDLRDEECANPENDTFIKMSALQESLNISASTFWILK